jgi:hypothetical protein
MPRSDDLGEDAPAEPMAAVDEADLQLADAVRRARRRRTIRRAVEGSAEFAEGLAEAAVDIAVEVVHMIIP